MEHLFLQDEDETFMLPVIPLLAKNWGRHRFETFITRILKERNAFSRFVKR